MRHLNYHHLLYFWTVAREGSIARASDVLHLTPQTISGQLKLLEEAVTEPLFDRVGRGLVLTDTGHFVFDYADEIFSLGSELAQRIRSRQPGRPSVLNVGIVNSIPKLIACRVLESTLGGEDSVRIVCFEAELEKLLADLAVHRLDMVLSDRQIPTGLNVKAYNHPLGSSDVELFAGGRDASRYQRDFPASLDGAPVLLPVKATALRRNLDDWFDRTGVSVRVIAEFEDSALLKAFGETGVGVFPAPSAIRKEVEHMYGVKSIGTVPGVTENYFAISPERKLKHPAVLRITEEARAHVLRGTNHP